MIVILCCEVAALLWNHVSHLCPRLPSSVSGIAPSYSGMGDQEQSERAVADRYPSAIFAGGSFAQRGREAGRQDHRFEGRPPATRAARLGRGPEGSASSAGCRERPFGPAGPRNSAGGGGPEHPRIRSQREVLAQFL